MDRRVGERLTYTTRVRVSAVRVDASDATRFFTYDDKSCLTTFELPYSPPAISTVVYLMQFLPRSAEIPRQPTCDAVCRRRSLTMSTLRRPGSVPALDAKMSPCDALIMSYRSTGVVFEHLAHRHAQYPKPQHSSLFTLAELDDVGKGREGGRMRRE